MRGLADGSEHRQPTLAKVIVGWELHDVHQITS